MDQSRLWAAFADALLTAFLSAGLFGPPDPVTQTLVVPAVFLIALPVAYRYDFRIYDRGWNRHVVFVVFVLAAQFASDLLARIGGIAATSHSPVRFAVLLAGTVLAAWVAYFGGLERLRGRPEVRER